MDGSKQSYQALRGAAGATPLLARNLYGARTLFSSLVSGPLNRAVADAKAASRSHDWPQAIWRWRKIIDEFGDKAPLKAFLALCKAHEYQGDFDAAETVAWEGRAKHPTDLRLIAKCAKIAMASKRWSEAAAEWRMLLDKDRNASADGVSKAKPCPSSSGRPCQSRGNYSRGRAIHPSEVSLDSELAKIATVQEDWPQAIWRWRKIIDEFGDKASAKAFLALYDAQRSLGDLDAAEVTAWEGRAKHPADIRIAIKGAEIAIERAEIAMNRQEWSQAAGRWHTVLDLHTEGDFALDGQFAVKACMGLVRGNDCDRVIGIVQELKKREGHSKSLLAIEGVAYLRSSQIELARLHWTNYWQRATQDQDFARQPAPPVSHKRPSRDFFPTLARTGEDVAERTEDRFCVYTALFGEYDDLRSPAFVPAGVKFICFSDRERDVAGWEVRVVDLELDTPALKNRKIKILPYDHLKDYDCSLYIDASIVFLADPLVVYHRWLKNESFVAWSHPERSGVYEEIEAILTGLRHTPAPLLDQYTYFGDQAVPAQSGLIEAGFLWRDHRDAHVRTSCSNGGIFSSASEATAINRLWVTSCGKPEHDRRLCRTIWARAATTNSLAACPTGKLPLNLHARMSRSAARMEMPQMTSPTDTDRKAPGFTAEVDLGLPRQVQGCGIDFHARPSALRDCEASPHEHGGELCGRVRPWLAIQFNTHSHQRFFEGGLP